MSSNFEEYLKSQRQNLDVEEPDDQLIWSGISESNNKPSISWKKHFWKAAAILILMASSTYVFINEFYNKEPQNMYNVTLSEIEPAYAKLVSDYRADINKKLQMVNDQNPGDVENLNFFFNELNGLDTMYMQYQEDFYNYGYDERLVKAMLDYYEKRMRVLDRMLMEIQKHKDYEKRKEEHTNI